MSENKPPRQWNMGESILVFQDNVQAVGPMISVIEAQPVLELIQQLENALKVANTGYTEFTVATVEHALGKLKKWRGDK